MKIIICENFLNNGSYDAIKGGVLSKSILSWDILQCWLMKVYQMKTAMIAVQMIVILSHWNGLSQFYCKLLLGTIYISNFLAIHQQHVLNVATSHSRVWHKETSCKHRQKDGKLMKITLIQFWDHGILSKFTVPGDGECLFISAAMNIKHSSQLGTESY